MKVLEKNNRIYFNLDDKSFANISIQHNHLKLELIETLPAFRKCHCASSLLANIFKYLKQRKPQFKIIYLNPLPLDRFGLKLDKLITFYKKFGFCSSSKKDESSPHLMEKQL